jgi:hydantoinase/carbamoylase family amidase
VKPRVDRDARVRSRRLATASTARADAGRIARFVREVGAVGRDRRGGWSRLALSIEERQAHEIFARWAQELGLDVHTDGIGNTFADSNGVSDQRAIVLGSHLDTVPRGGNFDGVAGIAAALEVIRVLQAEAPLEHRLRVAVFAGEEGARFGVPCIGSRVCVGALARAALEDLVDDEGKTVVECAEEVGLVPDAVERARWPGGSVAAYLELHIEQGSTLENRSRQIGIVDSIAGSTRLQISFRGRTDHSGATPMRLRQDALVAAAELILDVERQASAHPTSVATVGKVHADPGSLTTVPGEAWV